MANKRLIHLTLLCLAITMTLVACGGSAPVANQVPTATTQVESTATPEEAEPGTAEGKKVSGEMRLYTSRSESLINPVIEGFSAKYPDIKVQLLTGNNGQLAARILEERANPQADLFVNTDSLTMSSLAAEGVFAPYEGPGVDTVPAQYRSPDNTWTALTLRPRVIMYNTNLVKQDELPKSVLELTDPKWKGQVGSADSTNGSLQGQMVAMREVLGEAKTEEFVRGLVANDTKFSGGHTDVRKAVGAGELKLGLVNHYYYFLSKAEGAPVGIIYPDQGEGEMGLVVNSTNAGIVKGGPNPQAAKVFIDYVLSNEGQKIFADLNYEYPIIADVPLSPGLEPLDKFKVVDLALSDLWRELEPTKALLNKAGLP